MIILMNRTYGAYAANTQYTVDDGTGRNLINIGVAQRVDADTAMPGYYPPSVAAALGTPAGSAAVAAALGAQTFKPESNDYAGLFAAALAAHAAGGGVVPVGVVNIGDNTLPLLDNVLYKGIGFSYNWQTGQITSGSIVTSTSTTKPVFATYVNGAFTYTDLAAPYSTTSALHAMETHNTGVQDMAIIGGSFGIKAGALYQPGISHNRTRNVLSLGAKQWGFWFENCQEGSFEALYSQSPVVGQLMFAGSGSIWNYGNYSVRDVLGQSSAANKTCRNVEFKSRGIRGSLNDVIGINVQSNGSGMSSTQATTMTASSTAIGVTDLSVLAVDMPVTFSANVNGFRVYQAYFITSVSGSSGAGTITVSDTIGGTAIASNNSGAVNLITTGFFGIGVYSDNSDNPGTSPYPQNITITGIDVEAPGTAAIVVQNCVGATISTNLVPPGNTSACAQTLVSRASSVKYDSPAAGATIDADSASKVLFFGRRSSNKNAGSTSSIGFGLWYSEEATNVNGISRAGVIALRGSYIPDIYINSGTSNLMLNGGLDLAQKQYSVSAVIGSLGSSSSVVFTGAAGQTLTLPAPNATAGSSNIGWGVEISNPTANPVTIAAASGNILGGGVSAATYTLASNTTAMFRSCANGATLYWSVR